MSSRIKYLMLAAALLICATALYSYVPQTIVVDGSNDFLVANLMDADSTDCQFSTIDMDSIHVTNDANKLYIGLKHDKGGWGSVQIGVHISTEDTSGGTTDAWGRAIAWNTAPRKPNFQAYVNLDNSWQELREWNSGGTSWDALYQGVNSLGWVNNTGFEELPINLSDLGVSLGDTIYMEIVITQDGATKGPLDAMANDDQQLSTPTSTTFDVASPVELDSMVMYIIQTTGDSDPPTVVSAAAVIDAPGLDSSSSIEVIFSEPVDETTAENTGNYALGGTAANITSAVRNPSFPSRVTLNLDAGLAPQASFHTVTVTNVEDAASNVIVANGTTNVGCFFLKGIRFEADMSYHFLSHTLGTDTVSVEGGLSPLTWVGSCDNALMTDVGADLFVDEVYFSVPGSAGCSTASASLEWKLMHQCTEYEPFDGNRMHELTAAGGAWDTLSVFWNDEDPSQFTTKPIDVILTVDGNSMSPTVDSTMAVNGSVLPLDFSIPSITEMADDGVFPDAVASDGIYSKVIRFPSNSQKSVGFKYVYEDRYECVSEGDREVYLNDAAYDTLGGTLGPLVMPLQYFDRCSTIGRGVEVVFRVNALWLYPTAGDTIAVNGAPNNQLPEVINWNVPSLNPMKDDGVYPDASAGDNVYTGSIVFPDSSSRYQEYKYLFNSEYECTTSANRSFFIDDSYNDSGHPQVLDIDNWNLCGVTGIDDTPIAPFALRQNYPNPFNPTTTIAFSTDVKGRAVLRIYDVRGALVNTLVDEVVEPGETRVQWNGRDRSGRPASSGVYFYDLQINGKRDTRKMVLLR